MTDCQLNQPLGKNRQTLPNPHSVVEAQMGGAPAESKRHRTIGASDKRFMGATTTTLTVTLARTNRPTRVEATTAASLAPPQQCTTLTQQWQEQGVPHGPLNPNGRSSPTMMWTIPAMRIVPCTSHSPRPRPQHRSSAQEREEAKASSATHMPHK